MIDGIGRSEQGRVALDRASVERKAPVAKTGDSGRRGPAAAAASLAYEMLAAVGPPVDQAKVAAIRVAIAQGQYPVDPGRIAARMVELDLPAKQDA